MKRVLTEQSGMRTTSTRSTSVDAGALTQELRSIIRGEVRFDDGSRALYATDSSNYRQVPLGVVIPKDDEDLVWTIVACYRFGAPIFPTGGGSGLAGAIVIVWGRVQFCTLY